MPQTTLLPEFLQQPGPILDVRSPGEFLQGHIPESHSFALFDDKERAQIGTIYKKQSRSAAVELGLLLIQPKLNKIYCTASSLLQSHGKVLCWRGGMRSAFAARLLELLGYSMITLQGGYKTYRRQVLKLLSTHYFPKLRVLGGLTGSGKTFILKALHERGEQIIDLEAIARHCGSAFGRIGLSLPQPTQEQFENEIAWKIDQMDPSKPVWIEDESRLIGHCHIPTTLYQNMMQAPLYYIQLPAQERMLNLLGQYGKAPQQQLLEGIKRIAKRLGSQQTKEIQQLLEDDRRELAFEKLLVYYDKAYQYHIARRYVKYWLAEPSFSSPDAWAQACLAVDNVAANKPENT